MNCEKLETITFGNKVITTTFTGNKVINVNPTYNDTKNGIKIAEISLEDSKYNIYAPKPSGGSTITVKQKLTDGVNIAVISVDGNPTNIYAPEPSGVLVDDNTIKKFENGKIYVNKITKNKISDFGNYINGSVDAMNKTFSIARLSGEYKNGNTFNFYILSAEVK